MFLWFGFVKNPLMWPGGYNMEIEVSPNPCTIKIHPWKPCLWSLWSRLHCFQGNIWQNRCKKVFTLFCALLKCLDTCRHFSLSAHCQNCCGTPSMTTHTSLHQANTDKRTEPFAVQLTNTSTHTRTCIHARLITAVGCGFEAVTNCPASGGYPLSAFLFCSLMLF